MSQRKLEGSHIPAYGTVLVAVCVQLCATLMLLYGYTSEQSTALTHMGQWLCRPEREIAIFVIFCVVALLAGGVGNKLFPSILASARANASHAEAQSRTLSFLSLGSFLLYIPLAYDQMLQMNSPSPHHAYDLIPFFLPAVMLIVLAGVECLLGSTTQSRWASVMHGIGPFLFVALLLPKDWHSLSGYYFFQDEMFAHLNFFAVTPYVNAVHGRVLAAEAYSQYGLGWPTLFATFLSPENAQYAIFFLTFILFTVFYLGTFYGLLRMVTGNYLLALTGVVLWYGLVSMKHGHPFWGGPQALPARYPVDALVLGSLYAYMRTGRRYYAWAATGLLALALWWVMDTGVFLVVAVTGMLLLCTLNQVQGKTFNAKHYKQFALSHVALWGISVLVLVLISVRGAVFTKAFWSGWGGGLIDSGGGLNYGAIPFSMTGFGGLTLFVLLMYLYMHPILRALHRALNGTMTAREAFWAVVGMYGLELMLSFVSQSRETNGLQKYMHPAILLILGYYAMGYRMNYPRLPRAYRPVVNSLVFGIPLLLATGFALTVSQDKGLWPDQEGLWERQQVMRGADTYFTEGRLELRALSQEQQQQVRALAPIFELVRAAHVTGEGVAVLAGVDGALHLATDTRPYLGSPYLFTILTVEGRDDTLRQILDAAPEQVLLQVGYLPEFTDNMQGNLQDTISFFQENLGEKYQLTERLDAYEVWTLK